MIEIRSPEHVIMHLTDDAGLAIEKAYNQSLSYPNVVILIKNGIWEYVEQEQMSDVLRPLVS